MKKSFILIVVFLFVTSFLSAAPTYLFVGQSRTYEISATGYSYISTSWSVNNPSIALTGSGLYRNATVNAYFGGTATITVTITYKLYPTQNPQTRTERYDIACNETSISISPSRVSLDGGQTTQLLYGFNRTTYKSPVIQWTSSDSRVASVSGDGVVTGIKKGTATIYAKSDLGSNVASCTVTVLSGTGSDDEDDDFIEGDIRAINLNEAGILSSYISNSEMYSIKSLKLSGKLNGDDLRILRRMAGCDENRNHTDGQLQYLDLKDVVFVKGGNWYINAFNQNVYCTEGVNIPHSAFAFCTKLSKIILPKYSSNIGSWTFNACSNLQYVEMPYGLKEIGASNFTSSTVLTSLYIPSTVTSIMTDYYNSQNLTEITCKSLTPPYMREYFTKTNVSNGILHVPSGAKAAYRSSKGWASFGNIEEDADEDFPLIIKIQGEGAVRYNNDNLTNVYQGIPLDTYTFPIELNQSATLYLLPDNGYAIKQVLVNGTDVKDTITQNTLHIDNISMPQSIEILFSIPVNVESLILNTNELLLKERGETAVLQATILPENADDKTVSWYSTNPEVCSVDENGVVTALRNGTSTIICTSANGSLSASCNIVVKREVPISAIKWERTEFVYSGNPPQPKLENTLSEYIINIDNMPNLEKNVGSWQAVIPITFKDEYDEIKAEIIYNYSIIPALLKVKARDAVRTYGEENPALEITYEGFVHQETEDVFKQPISIKTTAETNSDVGTYEIIPYGGVADNYTFEYIKGLLTIEKAYQTIVWEQDFSEVQQFNQVELTAKATSGLEITYSLTGDNICSILKIGNKQYLDCFGIGEVAIAAQQEGNQNYWPSLKTYKEVSLVPTGIHQMNNKDYIETIYDINGHKRTKLCKGINIIHTKDNKMYKIIM